jgi:SAM-dependent MidA family methyltransferase
MTALKRKIVDLIEALGPISVAEYMAMCLFDKQHGYYMTRDPFDTTAISPPRPRSARCSAS